MFVCNMMPNVMKSIKTAIVILNWNGKSFLEKYLPSVCQNLTDDARLFVADNASTDDSIDFLTAHYPQVALIRLSKNYGFAQGYNEALKQVKATYYVLLNSDVSVTPKWIEPIINLMDNHELIAACQPKVRSLKQPELFEYAGASGGWIDRYGFPFCRGRVFEQCEKDEGQYEDSRQVFWATGACLFIRSEVYHDLGGLDGYFFAHQEEIDLCWRIQNAGYKVYVQPESIVYHLGGGSLSPDSPRKLFLNYRNNLIMLAKNLSSKERISKIFIRMILDGVAGLRFILKGQFRSCFAIIKAHFGFYKWLISSNTHVYRGTKKRMKNLTGVYHGSVVKEYFLNKKKTFSRIVENNL